MTHLRSLSAALVAVTVLFACADEDPVGSATSELTFPDALTTTDSVGAMPGRLSVGYDGQARYDLPIPLPPGRAGMQPSVALHYRSGGQVGAVGRGWSLSATSGITRCPKSTEAHGTRGGVRYEDTDAICLDGKPLVPAVTGATGALAPDEEFRTFPESHVRVFARYAGASEGPAHFEVWRPNGEVWTYGESGDEREMLSDRPVAHRWMLSRRRDVFGNEVRYRYEGATTVASDARHRPTLQLRQIEYTANPDQGLAATFWVRFQYETRPDVREGFVHGYAYGDDRRLERIQVGLSDGKVWRQVHLGYDTTGATGASRLASVEDCVRAPAGAGALTDDEGLVCRPETTFEWSVGDPDAGFEFLSRSWDGWIDRLGPTRGQTRVFPMDTNGDGVDDLVYTRESGRLAIRYGDVTESDLLGTTDPDASVVETDLDFMALPLADELDHQVRDWDGDGRDDLLLFTYESAEIRLLVLRSLGDDFELVDGGLSVPTTAEASSIVDAAGDRYAMRARPQALLADVTGDGHLDALVCVGNVDDPATATWPVENVYDQYEYEPVGLRYAIARGTASGFAAPELVFADAIDDPRTGDPDGRVPCALSRYSYARATVGDYTGDGIADVVSTNAAFVTTLSFESGVPTLRWHPSVESFPGIERVAHFEQPIFSYLRSVDLNGDGAVDLVGAVSDFDRLLGDNYDRLPSHRVAWLNRGDGTLEPMGFVAPGTFEDDARNDFYIQIPGAPGDRRRRWTRPDIGMDVDGDGRVELLARTVPPSNIMPRDLCDGPFGDSCGWTESIWHWGPFDGSILTWEGSGFSASGFGTFGARYTHGSLGELLDAQTQSLDVNGDGALDLISYDLPVRDRWSSETAITPSLVIQLNRTAVRERIVAVNDGVGGRDEVDYRPMSDPAVYTPGRDCAWPRRCQVGTGLLVREIRYESGTDKPFGYRYRYWDAQADREGRGALGFAGRVEEELHTGHVRVHHFHHASAGQPHQPWLRGRPTRVVSFIQTDEPQLDPEADSSRFLGTETTYDHDRLFDTATGNYVVVRRSVQTAHYESPHPTSLTPETASLTPFPDRRMARVDFEFAAEGPLAERAFPVRRTSRRIGTDDVATVETTYEPPTDDVWRLGRVATVVATTNEAEVCGGVTAARHEYDAVTGLLVASEQQPHELVPPRSTEDQEDEWLRTGYEFDALGNLTRVEVADLIGRTRATTIAYDAQGLHAESIKNPLGHEHQLYTEPFLGAVHAMVDANGLAHTVQFDGFGRVRGSRGPDGVESRTFYEPRAEGGFVLRTETDGGAPTTSEFDAAGRLLREQTLGFDGLDPRPVQVVYQRNDAGRVVGVSEPHYEGTAPERWSTYEYDALQVLRRTTALDGATTHRWRSLDARYSRDPLGRSRHVELDRHGRVARAVDAEGHATQYEYCLSGAPSAIVDPAGNATLVEYDALGRRMLLDDPDSGVTKFRHDVFGGVREELDPRGLTTETRYDALGRITEQADADGTTYWRYDEGDHAIGRLSWQLSADGVHDRFDYDALGRVASQTRTVDGVGMKYDFGYDGLGRLEEVAFPDATELGRFRVRYDHDAHGNLRAVRDGRSGDLLWRPTDIDHYGRLLGAEFADGTETELEFAPGTHRVAELVTRRGSERLRWQRFEYDDVGNVTYRGDHLHGEKEFFDYDGLDRLRSWTSNVDGTHTQDYDALGNITSSSDRGAYDYASARPHAATKVGEDAVSYDAAGNVLQWGSRSIEWNAQHMARLVRDGSRWMHVRYGAGGDRAAESGSEGTRLVFEDYELRDGGVEAFTVRVGREPVAQLTRSKAEGERLQVLHTDPLGSVDTVTEDGSVVSRTSYDPWGARRERPWTSTPEHVEHGYTGHEEDRAFGLVDMGARLYDPVARRTLSPDPIVGDPFHGQAFNRYSYVWNNPLRYVDPTGLCTEEQQAAHGGCEEIDFSGEEGDRVVVQLPTTEADDSAGGEPNDETNGANTDVQSETADPDRTQVEADLAANRSPDPVQLAHVGADILHNILSGVDMGPMSNPAGYIMDPVRSFGAAVLHADGVGRVENWQAITDSNASAGDRASAGLWEAVALVPAAATARLLLKGGKLARGFARLARIRGSRAAHSLGTVRIITDQRLQHTRRHAEEWFGRELTQADHGVWRGLIERASQSAQMVPWSTGASQTVGHLARVGRGRYLFVQYYVDGPRRGQLATAFRPNSGQLSAIRRLLRSGRRRR